MRIGVYGVHDKSSSDKTNLIGVAMATGAKRHGHEVHLHGRYNGKVHADLCICYGWINELTDKIFSQHQEAGVPFVFVDLGYWDRGIEGYYRIGINDWDTAKHMKRDCPSDRFNKLNVPLRDDWNPSASQVMIVGMSGKAAWTHGYKEGEWEHDTKQFLIGSARPGFTFYIRQKPNKQNRRIAPIEEDLKESRFVVSHHSNVAVDALVAGIPFWAKKGVGALISPPTLDSALFDTPWFPEPKDKMQLLYDIAYAQWTPGEMRSGACLDYIREVLSI